MNLRDTIKKYKISVSMLALRAGISQQLLHFRFTQSSDLSKYPATKKAVIAAIKEMLKEVGEAVESQG